MGSRRRERAIRSGTAIRRLKPSARACSLSISSTAPPRAIPMPLPSRHRELSLSYRELVTRADALAVALQAMEPEPQTRVGICAYNTVEHLTALLAVMAADKIWVPLNPLDASRDLETKIATAKPSLVIADEACLDKFDPGSATVLIGASCRPKIRRPTRTTSTLLSIRTEASGHNGGDSRRHLPRQSNLPAAPAVSRRACSSRTGRGLPAPAA